MPGVTGRRLASPIVGRARELEFLGQAFDGVVRDQACRLVTVLGSAGVGKSRLVEEFLNDRAGAATILRGRCLPYGEGITFWPIKSVVSQAAGLSGEESPEAAREKIRSLVAAAPDAGLIVERVAETIGLAKTAGQRGTLWALGRFFEELSSRLPLIVVFDDVQWGEPTILDLVEAVAGKSRKAPLLPLCLARPELLEVRPAWGEAAPDATRLLLGPFSEAESQRLITNLLGAPEHADEVRGRIVETAGGNPLFVEELVSMLLDQGLLGRNGSRAAGEWSRVALPPTVETVWRVLTAIEQWPSWNPDVKSVSLDGAVREGAAFRWKAGPSTISSTILRLDRPRLIAWSGRTLGIRATHVSRRRTAATRQPPRWTRSSRARTATDRSRSTPRG